jgi:hypothetical protein
LSSRNRWEEEYWHRLLAALDRALKLRNEPRVHRFEPLARPCAILRVVRFGRAKVKTTRLRTARPPRR